MHNIIICCIKLLYQYLCKRHFIILFLCIIIIIIIFQKFFIQYFFVKNKNNSNVPIIIKKNILYQPEDILNKKFYNKIIRVNFLKQYLYISKLKKEVIIHNYSVLQDDDILSKILIKCSNDVDSSQIDLLIRQYPILERLRIGQMFSWLVIKNRNLKSLIWDFSSQEVRIYNRGNTNFSEGIIRIINASNNRLSNNILFIGMLNETFIDSARSLGIEKSYIMDIVNALRYQLDFRKSGHKDKFAILISIIINDDYTIQSKFLGARLRVLGKDYYVFQANNGKFYDCKATRLGDDFIRFPIFQPFRISSNFNLHRVNPITRQVSPHAGVDFAIPTGTSVFSVGDGEVIVSAYSRISGNYLVIRHNYQCITRYMHLKKSLVKPGQQVKCGENIALSGNTGRSTGPHLHFEVWINHRPVNPLTIKLLNFEKLLGNDRIIYLNQIHKIIPKLCFD